MAERTWYLHCTAADVGDRAVLMGDRGRVALLAELLAEPRWLNEERGLTTVTGHYRDRRVTVSAFGMGAPIAAVVLHELAMLGVRQAVRLGTMLALPPARLGDLVLADRALRHESTSATYLPPGADVTADGPLNGRLQRHLSGRPRRTVRGLVASYDGFYTQMFAAEPHRKEAVADRLDELEATGVVGVDMETSAVLAVGRALGVRAASLCLASVDARSHQRLDGAERQAAERDLVAVGLAALTDDGNGGASG